ncbi:scavenger receptor cysteine-rich domain-containing protein DMBT1-like isoform X1 [Petromyzon marinus]|uniref:scavenger receptor cysteine-rich domain-containing protein DMBT1-like isoform X1 n=1 Tax=Petromyzon marinus TaxID=7757 RepID=UPI003F707BEC
MAGIWLSPRLLLWILVIAQTGQTQTTTTIASTAALSTPSKTESTTSTTPVTTVTIQTPPATTAYPWIITNSSTRAALSTTTSTTDSTTSTTPVTTDTIQTTPATTAYPWIITNSSNAALRLVDRQYSCQGRVEILQNGTWESVCFYYPSISYAVCQELGCGQSINYNYYYVEWYNTAWTASCTGLEKSMSQCTLSRQNQYCSGGYWDPTKSYVSCSAAGLRLVGGANRCEGRMEVYKNGVWGELCSSTVNRDIADGICRLLGCGWSLAYGSNVSAFGLGQGTIFPDNLSSPGNRIYDNLVYGTNNCSLSQTAAIICEASGNRNQSLIITGPTNDMIHLVDREMECQGRVEIFNNGEWGTICRSTSYMGNVACRELGCGYEISSTRYNTPLPVPTLSVQCDIAANNISECNVTPRNKYDCLQEGYYYTLCSAKGLRLVGGTNRCEGRVAISRNGVWNEICDSTVDTQDADMICHLLDCGWSVARGMMSQFGVGAGTILPDNLVCSPYPNQIFDCLQIGTNNCSQLQTAAIICEASGTANPQVIVTETENGTIRLVDREMNCRGRVEINNNGTWGSLCDAGWTLGGADVVCRQMQCGNAVDNQAYYGKGPSPKWTATCGSLEDSLFKCTLTEGNPNSCTRISDAGVQCTGAGLRLVSGRNRCEGRVEVLKSSVWSGVCSSALDTHGADTICRLLGCGWSLSHGSLTQFMNTPARILSDNVACAAFPNTIFDCLQTGTQNCSNMETAAVICEAAEPTSPQLIITANIDGTIQLVDRDVMCQGKVEIYNNGSASTLCRDSWDEIQSEIVCQQLNCGSSAQFGYYGNEQYYFGIGRGTSQNARCGGTEQALTDCTLSPENSFTCTNKGPAGVVCTAAGLRLVGGANRCEGRMEVYKNGVWGELCSSTLNRDIADGICHLLGCGWSLAYGSNVSTFGLGQGTIFPDNLSSITGNIFSSLQYGTNNCSYDQTAAIICEAAGTANHSLFVTGSTNGRVRLVDRELECQGRVEVFHNGSWGTLCGSSWDVCGELQCGSLASAITHHGLLQRPTWNAYCSGMEQSLADCNLMPGNKYQCAHSGYAGVVCSAAGVRLLGGNSSCEGLLEVYRNGVWAGLCSSVLDYQDADVICRFLHCGKASFVGNTTEFGLGSTSVLSQSIACVKTATSIGNCSWVDSVPCHYTQAASVICAVPVEKTIVFSGYDGVILSNNFTMDDKSLTYTFVIQSRSPNAIKIKIENISLQESNSCVLQRLEVWDGQVSEGNSLAVLCGGAAVGQHIKSTKQVISLVLKTRGPLDGRGFNISYTSIKVTRPSVPVTCGTTSVHTQSPWVVQMQNVYGYSYCNGALIGIRWILTSATCVYNRPVYEWRVNWFGYFDNGWWAWWHWTWSGNIAVANIFVHPKYNASRPDYDIALVELSQSIQPTEYINPACLPYFSEAVPFSGKYCYLHSTSGRESLPYSIIDTNECKSFQFNNSGITSRMICTQSEQCRDMSPQFLMCQGVDGLWYVAGIGNRLVRCEPNGIDLRAFARVRKFVGFIKATSGLEAYHQV